MVFKELRKFLGESVRKVNGVSLRKLRKRREKAGKIVEEAIRGPEPPIRESEAKCGPLVDRFKNCAKFVREIMLEKPEVDIISDISRTTTSGVKGSAMISAKRWNPRTNEEERNDVKVAADILVEKGLLARRRTQWPDRDVYTLTERAYCAKAVFPTHQGKCICGEGAEEG